MRDIQSDRDAGLSTLATYLGFDLAKRITITSLVFWLVLFEVRTILEINYALAIAGFVIFLLGLIGISKLRIDKSELFFVIVFEGLIAFYAASILLFG